jgi:hypothetical protein
LLDDGSRSLKDVSRFLGDGRRPREIVSRSDEEVEKTKEGTG